MGATDGVRLFVLKTESGRYVDDAGYLTWARSMARIFTGEQLAVYRAGVSLTENVDAWTAIEVDERGVALSRREPVTG